MSTFKYCSCDKIMDYEIKNNDIYFKCKQCDNITKPSPEDTLLYNDIKDTGFVPVERIRISAYDETEPKVDKSNNLKCNKKNCIYEEYTRVTYGESLKTIYTCKCGDVFINSLNA